MGTKFSHEKLKETTESEAYEIMHQDETNYIESPHYHLDSPQELTEFQQKQITWLMVQFKPKGEPLKEEVEGYTRIYKKNRYGVKESRWLLLTTFSIYIVEANDFTQLNLRIPIENLTSLGYSLDNTSFGINSKAETSMSFWFYSQDAISIVNAIKIMYYLMKEDFLTIILADSTKMLKKILAIPAEPEEPDVKLFTCIKDIYGTKGEYLITSITLYERKPVIDRRKLVLSNMNIYLVKFSGRVISILPLATVIRLFLLSNHLDLVIKTSVGDLWLIYSQAYAILKEISEVLFMESKINVRIQFREPKEVAFKRVIDVVKNKD
ncbi:hypothetical protein SteCoe_2911 [Stentor coeruleus]|uniref:TH1 domain-containing protein n=1 Tax=Stentor coeruleus TaxID=5963 RepID=A0A1R2CYB6_9CILI|nr:hypothetical protein SteCoe_2911 [Stentor coeruleus]